MIETVYEHVRGRNTFTVTAAEQWSIGLINRLKERFPNEVEITHVNDDKSLVAHLPYEWMRIVPKKRISEEQRERMKGVNPFTKHE